ncbi:hypothetical protein BGX38DRAFT_1273041 [Terfezia claveryi]|nr:hypothetical protein BGX38DRAFT_1273041 [Terfezia claveryi]
MSNAKPFLCTYTNPTTSLPCTAAFSRPCRLNEHMNTHTDTRPFICPHCGSAFYRQTHLYTHIKQTHKQIRSHTCPHPECGKTFTTRQHLNRHVKTHGKGLAHSCTGHLPCTEQFRKKTQLERVEHMDVRGWVCKCLPEVDEGGEGVIGEGKRSEECFETKRQLSRHIKREHGTENRYFCEECTVGNDGEVVGRSSATRAVKERVTVVDSQEHEVPSERKLNDLETLLKEFLKNAGDSDSNPDFEMDESQDQFQGPPDPATTTDTTNTNTTTPLATATTPSFTTSTLAQPLGFKTWSSYQHHLLIYHPPCVRTVTKYASLTRVSAYTLTTTPLLNSQTIISTVHEGEKNHICPQEGCGRAFGHKGSMKVHFKKHFRALERAGGQQARREAGQAEVGQTEVRRGEVGRGEVGQGEVGQTEIGQADVAQTQEGQAENWQAGVGQAEVGEAEVWQAEVGQAEVGEAEVGQAEVGQAAVGQAGVWQGGDGGLGSVSAEESTTLRHNPSCTLDESENIWYGIPSQKLSGWKHRRPQSEERIPPRSRINYDETYAQMMRPETFKIITLNRGWAIRQWEMIEAYLQALLEHDVYTTEDQKVPPPQPTHR